jgi:hypothetical protein
MPITPSIQRQKQGRRRRQTPQLSGIKYHGSDFMSVISHNHTVTTAQLRINHPNDIRNPQFHPMNSSN